MFRAENPTKMLATQATDFHAHIFPIDNIFIHVDLLQVLIGSLCYLSLQIKCQIQHEVIRSSLNILRDFLKTTSLLR